MTAAPDKDLANAIRALAMDAVQAAGCGHPGAPMGMAEIAVALWGRSCCVGAHAVPGCMDDFGRRAADPGIRRSPCHRIVGPDVPRT